MFLESNWTWLAERWGNMADLAERVDDLICNFDSAGDTTMDTLSMLIFGWMLFGLIVLCVGKFIYNRFVLSDFPSSVSASGGSVSVKEGHIYQHQNVVSHTNSPVVGRLLEKTRQQQQQQNQPSRGPGSTGGASSSPTPTSLKSALTGAVGIAGAAASSTVAAAASTGGYGPTNPINISGGVGGYVPPTPPVRKRLTRKTSGPLLSPVKSSRALHLPTATGADAHAVRWVNELIVWLHSDLVILNELLAVWVTSLNDFIAGSVDEVSLRNSFIQSLCLKNS